MFVIVPIIAITVFLLALATSYMLPSLGAVLLRQICALLPMVLLFLFAVIFPPYMASIFLIGREFSKLLSIMRTWFNLSVRLSFTAKAKEHRRRWLEYASFIRSYSELEKQPAKYHELWGEHYTYALAVGAVKDRPNEKKLAAQANTLADFNKAERE